MNFELKIISAKIPGLVRTVSFSDRELESIEQFLMLELADEVSQLRADESRLMSWIDGNGKKIRF